MTTFLRQSNGIGKGQNANCEMYETGVSALQIDNGKGPAKASPSNIQPDGTAD
jgi:hypothetical protein